ncbi:MAG TPA: hypothetical protein VN444_06260 [Verrucomicrobiae bacterium]|nr:hypothetical protein [Verrucomicrobiae bacterium]
MDSSGTVRDKARVHVGVAASNEAGVADNPVNDERDIRIVGLHVEAPDGGVS